MIACRLSTILGAKRLKVSDVCRGTGIARATLDRYYYDRVNSFDREVLGKLCQFLQVKPGDLLAPAGTRGSPFGSVVLHSLKICRSHFLQISGSSLG